MENVVIIVIVAVVIILGLLQSRKHFSGGGCCGSGSTIIRSKKSLTEPKLGERTLTIEGMHCENCAIRVENALNRLDGVVCKVNLRKNTAVVSYSKEVPDQLLREPVEKLGYQVTQIR